MSVKSTDVHKAASPGYEKALLHTIPVFTYPQFLMQCNPE